MPRSLDDWGRDAEQRPAYTLLKASVIGVIIVLICTAVVGVATTGSVFFQSASSDTTLKARENIQRNSTENAVTSIAFFHQTCEDFNRQRVIVTVNEARSARLSKRATTTSDPILQQQYADQADAAATDAEGAFNVLVNTATDYNAKAANSLNAKFREAGLPERLPTPDLNSSIPSVNCG